MKPSIVFLGATGSVGGASLDSILKRGEFARLTLLGRRVVEGITSDKVEQHTIDIFEPASYAHLLHDHTTAVCTLGVGQPSKMPKDQFLKIDKYAVIDFAKACKHSGVKHFQLLSSVGINAKSSSFYLRSKGELVEELKTLQFERLSIFQPSMILTAENRYGLSQGILLKLWPALSTLLIGTLSKYRGVKVEQLGRAIAKNTYSEGSGIEFLDWNDFQKLS